MQQVLTNDTRQAFLHLVGLRHVHRRLGQKTSLTRTDPFCARGVRQVQITIVHCKHSGGVSVPHLDRAVWCDLKRISGTTGKTKGKVVRRKRQSGGSRGRGVRTSRVHLLFWLMYVQQRKGPKGRLKEMKEGAD